MKRLLPISVILVLLGPSALNAEETITIMGAGTIGLLPGYTHQRVQGIDTWVGSIAKRGGLIIKYDIGWAAGNQIHSRENQDKILWTKNQVVAGQSVQVAQTRDKKLMVTFPKHWANFWATVNTEEDLAEFLLTALTFKPQSVK